MDPLVLLRSAGGDGGADRPEDVVAFGYESQPFGHGEAADVVRAGRPRRSVMAAADVGHDGRRAGSGQSLPAMRGVSHHADVLESVPDEEWHRDGDRGAGIEGRPRHPGRGEPGGSAPGVADPAELWVQLPYGFGVRRRQPTDPRVRWG